MTVAMTTNGTSYLDTVPMLRRTGLKNFLAEGQLKDLEVFCRPSVRRAGTTLFRQDEPADAVYFIVEGSVELRARPPGRRIYRTEPDAVADGGRGMDRTRPRRHPRPALSDR